MWKSVVWRFGVPWHLVSNNRTQFFSRQLGNLCQELGIKQIFASIGHPQTNSQVESVNRVILRGLRRRLEKAKGGWAEEVPRIFCSYHTTPHSNPRETPFNLVYGTDAMIPVEIFEDSSRVRNFTSKNSNKGRTLSLDLIEEVCDRARINSEALKWRVEKRFKTKVNQRQFSVSNLVLHKAHLYQLDNKLSSKWACPYRVMEALENGAYRLETLDGGSIPQT